MYVCVRFLSKAMLELDENGDAVPPAMLFVGPKSSVGERVPWGHVHGP